MAAQNGNGKLMSQKRLKMLPEMVLQQEENVETMLHLVHELRIAAADAGWNIPDAQTSRELVRGRSESAGFNKKLRERIRKQLGLGEE